MRLAVISDIHGNMEAFREVLEDIDLCRADVIVSLGDNIGYGPAPQEVLDALEEKSIASVMGNHELGIADVSYAPWFNRLARKSLQITQNLLEPSSIDSIRTLKPVLSHSGCLFVHGAPPDSVVKYIFEVSDDDLAPTLLAMKEDVCFVGHTHELGLVSFDGAKVRREELEGDSILLPAGGKYIVNAGSVGQPRDGDNRAKYVIWDDRARMLKIRRLAYDIEKTARRIIELGFPRINADRLR